MCPVAWYRRWMKIEKLTGMIEYPHTLQYQNGWNQVTWEIHNITAEDSSGILNCHCHLGLADKNQDCLPLFHLINLNFSCGKFLNITLINAFGTMNICRKYLFKPQLNTQHAILKMWVLFFYLFFFSLTGGWGNIENTCNIKRILLVTWVWLEQLISTVRTFPMSTKANSAQWPCLSIPLKL